MTHLDIDIIKIKYLINALEKILIDIENGICYGNTEYIENLILLEKQKLQKLKEK